jgi:hypothetical protein
MVRTSRKNHIPRRANERIKHVFVSTEKERHARCSLGRLVS